MSARDLSNMDASAHAGTQLDVLLRKPSSKKSEGLISVEEALRQAPIVQSKSVRSTARVLFISQDTTLLNPVTQSLDGYLQLKDLFEEVHILIMRTGIPAKNPVLRVEENVWLYTAGARSWWQLPKKGFDLIEQELVFAQGFRPDLIVARDPFESGLIGKRLAQKYQTPLQVHVLTNYTGEKFRHQATKNFWRRFLPRYTLPAAKSVRTDSESISDVVKKQFEIEDISVLPKYSSYDAIVDGKPSFSLVDRYRSYSFFFLCTDPLGKESKAYQVIDAARFVLQNPRVGLIFLGDGTAKKELKERAKILGIEKQVIFESKVSDLLSYLKGAHVLITTETSQLSDEGVLKAAAAGLPTIMARNERREDWFEQSVSGLLCESDDVASYTEAINLLLNNAGQRKMMGEYAQAMIRQRFHNNADQYREEYRKSIEEAIFVGE